MLPEHLLSTQVIYGNYLYPDNKDPWPVEDYELGGVALNDPTQGLQVKVWKARYFLDGVIGVGNVYIGADDVPEIVFYSSTEITEISFTFDQNMNPVLAFMEGGQAKLRWYDPTISGYTVTVLPVGSRSPRCSLDDKRIMETATSDIILAYMRDDKLYFREQRDRYLIEYELESGLSGDLLMVGMTDKLRLQFAIGQQEYPPTVINYRATVDGRSRITASGDSRRIVGVSYG